jgi:predicted Ser/Thr protein kinase
MTTLKRDLFGTITLADQAGIAVVIRDTRAARPWLRWLARRLARREARALEALSGIAGVPRLLRREGDTLVRAWIPAEPMQRARPCEAAYYRDALRLVRRLHARDVAHNDLAKETNWLVTPGGAPALVDFQLAMRSARRGRLFRALAYDDLRHLLKHKRSYAPQGLTARQRSILARPSLLSRAWMASGKHIYLFVTRRVLRWADREGAGDRRIDA